MRRAPTDAEAALWQLLRGKRLGVRFRRQQAIGPFIADFFCAAHRLIVEIDGPQHDDEPERDARRTAWLNERGYRVVRFRNAEVMADLDAVYARLRTILSFPP